MCVRSELALSLKPVVASKRLQHSGSRKKGLFGDITLKNRVEVTAFYMYIYSIVFICFRSMVRMTYRLTREIDLQTGVVVVEEYRLNGKLHREPNEGPAYVYRNPEDGLIGQERYYWHGRLHRSDGPARVAYDITSTIMLEENYYHHGLLHRDPKQGAAFIERNGDGVVVTENYFVNGFLYRDPADGPRHISRRDDGSVARQEFSELDEMPPCARPPRKRKGPEPAP